MTPTAPHRPRAEPFSTGASWLFRALAVSVVLHAVVAVAWWLTMRSDEQSEVELVDIEVAPEPPKAEALPAEIARPPEPSPEALASAANPPEAPAGNDEGGLADAGVDAPVDASTDAPVDAPAKKKKRADAGVDAEVPLVADEGDAGVPSDAEREGRDAGAQVAMVDPGGESASETGSAADPGVPGAIDAAQGSGAPGMDTQPAVDGAPTSAGTAANLLAYFPPGHQITVLIRFDRLRKTEWAEPATRLFKPMPDYGALFGGRDVALADQLDMLVISSPRPRDATATTLVGHTQLSRAQMRAFLANPAAPIEWSATKGGMFGKRTGKLFPNDRRVLLSPWHGWFVLAQPDDLVGLLGAAKGNLDAIEVKGKLPPWLATIRTIEQETVESPKPDAKAKPGGSPKPGDDQRGPALVLTLRGAGKRYDIPDLGIGVTTAPSPERLSLAMELVKQGWLVRGNIVFASESDATEFVQTVQDVQTRIMDSRILSGLLKKQHALNAITGLSLARTGARVSYATSISIADARALLAAAAQTLDAYFANPP
jgi:hypothetical protein